MTEKKLFRPRTYHVHAPADLSKRWCVYWYDAEGVRQRKEKGINKHTTAKRRRQAAQELIKEIKREHRHLRLLSSTEKSIWEFFSHQVGRWSNDTMKEYRGILQHFLNWLNGREISENLLRRYFSDRRQILAPASWNKHRNLVASIISGIGCPDYWWETLAPQQVNSAPARYFQSYQVQQLGKIMALKQPELWLYAQFMFYTFIRPKELRGLRAGDIMHDVGEIRVPAAISKNKKTQYVAIPDEFLPAIQHLQEVPPGKLIFPGKTGKQLGKNTMYRRHDAILKDLEYGDDYTLYSWKHTGAVFLAKEGVSVKEIQMQMRHHSLDQTDQYLRQLGVRDVVHLRSAFPNIMQLKKPSRSS